MQGTSISVLLRLAELPGRKFYRLVEISGRFFLLKNLKIKEPQEPSFLLKV